MFLEDLDKALITINTVPEQTIVSKQGKYILEAPIGEYTLIATYETQNFLYTTEEIIKIEQEGTYNIDLILTIENQEEILEGPIKDLELFEETKTLTKTTTIITSLIILFFVLYLFFARKHFSPKKTEETSEPIGDLEELIDFIKKHDGRVTQKEIRKQFPLSEAKVSLMLAELESAGKIKKIKKGRGNIIILKK